MAAIINKPIVRETINPSLVEDVKKRLCYLKKIIS